MAKYEVTFSCGHTETVALFGKHTERERKIKYYEECGHCSECRRAYKAAEPLTANITFNADRNQYVVILSGNTYEHKAEIKSLHFEWNDEAWAWVRYAEDEKGYETIANEITDGLSVDVNIKIASDKEIERKKELGKKLAIEKVEREAEIEKVKATKPIKPACVAEGYWNGKVYGKEQYGYNVYIDNKKKDISIEEYTEIKKYEEEMAEYKERLAKVQLN